MITTAIAGRIERTGGIVCVSIAMNNAIGIAKSADVMPKMAAMNQEKLAMTQSKLNIEYSATGIHIQLSI